MNRILHVIGAMDRAGAETLIMNIYRQIDKSQMQFDFLVHTTKKCDYDNEIISLGGRIFRLPDYNGFNTFAYRNHCRKFFSTHTEYKVVHGHIGKGAPIYLSEAKKIGCKTIAHAHSENFYKGLTKIAFKVATFPTRYIADNFMACSPSACRATFGKKVEASGTYILLKNGINISDYECTKELHRIEKDKLGLSDKIVFCHIGRFIKVKNHEFLIRTFKHIQRKIPNSILLLCGNGALEARIKKLASSLGLSDFVYFLGIRDDIPDILRATDVFIFPSESEGAGISAIEAQASGAICLLSSGIPELVFAAENAISLPLSDGEEKWANTAMKAFCSGNFSERQKYSSQVRASGYDIMKSSKLLEKYYKNLIG